MILVIFKLRSEISKQEFVEGCSIYDFTVWRASRANIITKNIGSCDLLGPVFEKIELHIHRRIIKSYRNIDGEGCEGLHYIISKIKCDAIIE